MKLTDKQKQAIKDEFDQWKHKMYANKTLTERQDIGAFFTPPELSIKMIEKFNDLNDSILDPTAGAGGLLAACIMAGADPKKFMEMNLMQIFCKCVENGLKPSEFLLTIYIKEMLLTMKRIILGRIMCMMKKLQTNV